MNGHVEDLSTDLCVNDLVVWNDLSNRKEIEGDNHSFHNSLSTLLDPCKSVLL